MYLQGRHRDLGTPIELLDLAPSQMQVERTQTSPGIPPNATASPTNPTIPSHLKRLQTWWSHTIRPHFEHGLPAGPDPRDYLALERTFLGWFRTSIALITLGVIITQLFVLKDLDPLKGKILGAVMSCGGISVVLLGCIRYFRQQKLLTQGKVLSGGWHHQTLIVMLLVVLIALFVVVILDG